MKLPGRNAVLLSMAGFFLLCAGSAQAITVTSGYDSSYEPLDFGVRYRSFQPTGGDEVYLGVPDLGVAGNRNAQNINWASGPTTFDFTFTYDPVTDTLTSTVAGNAPLTYTFAPDLVIDVLQLDVVDRDTTGEIWLTNLMVNGESAGDFLVGGEGYNTWMLTDIASGPGLTVTGTINRTGTFGSSQELSKIQILAGGSPVPVPAAIWLFGSGLLGMVGIARRKKTA